MQLGSIKIPHISALLIDGLLRCSLLRKRKTSLDSKLNVCSANIMSVNDGIGGESPSETQLTQTWNTIEKEHVHDHFRKHFKYWQRHPRKAAESCVRNWREFFPDEADKLAVDKVVEYQEYVRKSGQLADFATTKPHVLVSRVQQPKGIQRPSVIPW
jgi:hypothetical protein